MSATCCATSPFFGIVGVRGGGGWVVRGGGRGGGSGGGRGGGRCVGRGVGRCVGGGESELSCSRLFPIVLLGADQVLMALTHLYLLFMLGGWSTIGKSATIA
jgi:hypothetical protein